MMALLTPEQKDKLIQLKKDRAVKQEAMAAKRLEKIKATLNLSDVQVAKIKAAKEEKKRLREITAAGLARPRG